MARRPRTIEGQDLTDATKPLVITITAQDVKGSNRKHPESCAAAKAICRQLHATEARVFKSRTYVKLKGKWIRFVTPQSLRTELVSFDRSGQFEPGDYRLPIPQGAAKLGGHVKPTGPKHRTSRGTRPLHVVAGVRDNAKRGRGMDANLERFKSRIKVG